MPAKIARSAPRPPFGPPEVTVAKLASILPEGRKTANICPNLGVIRGIPVNMIFSRRCCHPINMQPFARGR